MKLRILLLSLALTITFEIVASYDNYGRDYSMHEEHGDTPLWFVIVIIVGIWAFYKLLNGGISKLDEKSKSSNKVQNNVTAKSTYPSFVKTDSFQNKCNVCSGTGWDKTLQDITHLRKKCCKCEGKGFIASSNYKSIQLQINDIDNKIDNQFLLYYKLLSDKLNSRIAIKKEYYENIGEEFLDYKEALERIEEVKSTLRASMSYKILKQTHEKEINELYKNTSENISASRFCYKLLSCKYCMLHRCNMVKPQYKKLKYLYDKENRKIIEEYVQLISKYSDYINRAKA